MRRTLWTVLCSVPLLLAACAGEGTAPRAVAAPRAYSTTSPIFLELFGAPPLVSASVSFYAVRYEDREASIFFQHPGGGPPTGSDRAARIRVRKRSLDGATLNGVPVGDSVLITMTVVDVQHQIFELQPAGLLFNPRDPGRLAIWYRYANHDFNGDGAVNAADLAIETTFAIWRQESVADPFTPLVSVPIPVLDQVGAQVPGFTRFAVAY